MQIRRCEFAHEAGNVEKFVKPFSLCVAEFINLRVTRDIFQVLI